MQPYSHLPISPFALDQNDLPESSPPASPRTRGAMVDAPNYNIQSTAQYLPKDTGLLSSIAILEELRCESNIASFIRAGGLDKLRTKYSEQELVERGRRILGNLSIEVSRVWRPDWSLV
jgi:hypothetical protein